MKINQSISYQEANSAVQLRSKVLVGLIFTCLLLLIFTREIHWGLFFLLFIVLEIWNLNTAHGTIDIKMDQDDLGFQISDSQQKLTRQISSYQFSWNYEYLADAWGNITETNDRTLIQLKLELVDIDGQKIILLQELYPWQDPPKDWNYKLLENDYNKAFRVKKGLIPLKNKLS